MNKLNVHAVPINPQNDESNLVIVLIINKLMVKTTGSLPIK